MTVPLNCTYHHWCPFTQIWHFKAVNVWRWIMHNEIPFPRSSVVQGDEGCIGARGKLLCLWSTQNNDWAHARQHSVCVWLLGWSGCSSPSTKELHFPISCSCSKVSQVFTSSLWAIGHWILPIRIMVTGGGKTVWCIADCRRMDLRKQTTDRLQQVKKVETNPA